MKTDPSAARNRTPKRQPRGFTLIHRPDRPLPYGVRWRSTEGRHSRQFASEQERTEFIQALAAQGRAARMTATVLSPADAQRLERFHAIVNGADLLEVARFWADRHSPLLLGDAVARYLAAQEGRKLAGDTVSHRRLHLARLVEALGSARPIGSITPADLRAWLDRLVLDKRPASAASKRHHRANACRLWTWLRAEGLAQGDPFAAVPVEQGEQDEITLLSVDEGRHLFAVNRDHPSLPRMATEAFAGLRFSSAQRLTLADINWADRGIVLPAAVHKSQRRHYIDSLPPCVWEWLALATPATWQVSPRVYAIHKSEMFRNAGFVGERFRNCLRHSFASYHSSAYKSPGLTASILTHRSEQLLWRHYKGRAKEADGLAWFEIRPAESSAPVSPSG